jgi:hypothetical protein
MSAGALEEFSSGMTGNNYGRKIFQAAVG